MIVIQTIHVHIGLSDFSPFTCHLGKENWFKEIKMRVYRLATDCWQIPRKKATLFVIVMCQATMSFQNSFTEPWEWFYKTRDLQGWTSIFQKNIHSDVVLITKGSV